jgi:hypothetical protein
LTSGPAQRVLFFAEKFLGPSAICASKRYEVRLGFAGLVSGDHHYGAAAKANGVFSRVQRIEQKVLVAHVGKFPRTASLPTAETTDSCESATAARCAQRMGSGRKHWLALERSGARRKLPLSAENSQSKERPFKPGQSRIPMVAQRGARNTTTLALEALDGWRERPRSWPARRSSLILCAAERFGVY